MRFFISELKKLFLPCALTAIFFMGIFIFDTHDIIGNYVLYENIDIWLRHSNLASTFYSVIAVAPVCWLIYYERKNNYIVYTISRMSKKKYITCKWLVTATAGALTVTCINLFGLLFSLYWFEDVSREGVTRGPELGYFGQSFFGSNQLAYGLAVCAWRFFIAFIMASMGVVLAFYIKNIFIVLITPFLVVLLQTFSIQGLPFEAFDLITLYDSSGTCFNWLNYQGFAIALAMLIGIILVMWFGFAKVAKMKVYDF